MSENFDPYHKWLGIAPNEQPPNHYRLLGLNLYESDADVISNASERQMRHLRSFQIGPRVSDCQRLLNEVAGARVVLLDAQKKSAYDQTLRASLGPPEAPPPVNAVPLTPDDMLLPPGSQLAARPTALPVSSSAARTSSVVVAKRTRRRRKQPISVGTLVFGGMIGLFVLFACGYGLRVALQPAPRPITPQERPAEITSPPRVASVEPAERPAAALTAASVEPEVEPAARSQSDNGELAELPPGAVLVMTFEPSTLKRQGYVLDVSQHGYVGVVHGAIFAEGIAGNALAFDGKDDYVEVASTPWLSAPPAFSLAAWVNVVSWKDPRDAVDYVLSNESAGYLGYVLRYREGGIANLTVGVSQWYPAVSTKKASLGEWHHMAATFDGQIASIFLDGELDGTATIPGAISPSPAAFRIGQAAYRKDRGIRGRIDEVAIFNRALSPDEVRTVFRIGRAGRPLME